MNNQLLDRANSKRRALEHVTSDIKHWQEFHSWFDLELPGHEFLDDDSFKLFKRQIIGNLTEVHEKLTAEYIAL